MYSYRINNSYSVEINQQYYAEAKRVCDSIRCRKRKASHRLVSQRSGGIMVPLNVGTRLVSVAFGEGISQTDGMDGTLLVRFGEKSIRFLYPDALRQGHLKIV